MGNAKNRQSKGKPGPRSRRRQSRAARVPEDTPVPPVQPDNSEDLRRTRQSRLRYQCLRCPHHPILTGKDSMISHKSLHKMQQRVKITCFKDGVRIPENHPAIAVMNHRFMVQRTSRKGVSYYVLTNPVVLLIRAEDDPLVREQYNRALQNYNRTRPNNNDEAANGQEGAAVSNEDPAASAKAKVSGTRKSKRLSASCHAKDDNKNDRDGGGV